MCDALTRAEQPLCPRCLARPQLAVAVLQSRASGLDAAAARLVQVPLRWRLMQPLLLALAPLLHAVVLCLRGRDVREAFAIH